MHDITVALYLITVLLFIAGLKLLTSPRTARLGNLVSAVGMTIAIVATFLGYWSELTNWTYILIGGILGSIVGAFLAYWVDMRDIPQFVAILNSFGGAVSALVGAWAIFNMDKVKPAFASTGLFVGSVIADAFIGTIAFVGSVIAFAKLQKLITERPVVLPMKNLLNILALLLVFVFGYLLIQNPDNYLYLYAIFALAAFLGFNVTMAVGGADMPVVISLLISYAGLSAAALGFTFMNYGLIMVGSLVGASGLILTRIMAKAMNRDFWGILLGNITPPEMAATSSDAAFYEGKVKSTSPDEVAMMLKYADRIVVIPGYGLAVAQAQRELKELYDLLTKEGKEVYFAIHDVAGRMPGHMNVLLAEVEVPYEALKTMDEGNQLLEGADVALVVGANDVVNPLAKEDPSTPIYGMPILEADKAKSVVVIKRSLSPGFAGIPNPLFIRDNTVMLFDDAKKALRAIIDAYKEL